MGTTAPTRFPGLFCQSCLLGSKGVPSPDQSLILLSREHRGFLVEQGELVSRGVVKFLVVIADDSVFHYKRVWCGFGLDQLSLLLHDVGLAAVLAKF